VTAPVGARAAEAFDAGAVHGRVFRAIVGTAFPSAAVAAYVVSLVTGTGGLSYGALFGTVLAPTLVVTSLQQWIASRLIVRGALRARPGEGAAGWLGRILEAPRRIEVFSNVLAWTVGGAFYGSVLVARGGGDVGLVAVTTGIAAVSSLFPGLILVALVEDALRPAAIEVLRSDPRAAPAGRGFFWPRQRWYLPYAFVTALGSLVLFAAMIVGGRWSALTASLSASIRAAAGPAAAEEAVSALQGLARSLAVPLLGVTAILLVAFVLTGFLLARRQARAAGEIEASLRSMAAGAPELPRWISTDEAGDLAAATAGIALELRGVFEQLRAMASGDLGRDLAGESGLIQAFRGSRDAMRELAARMERLSRGEAVEVSRVAGDLGQAFGRLQEALSAIADQARTIADGDLRRDVDLPGALGEAIQRMTGNLRAMVGRTQGVAGEVGGIVVSLQAAAAQLSAATTQQVAAVTETANTMTEMAQTSAVSADRASELIKQGESAAGVVEEGAGAAESAVQSMAAITGSLDKVAQASGALAERVQKIDGITETVTFLADQSSTLAINAAIEAARAGEAGKGFSVVAREIRTLAADSRKAAAQIRELLSEIRERTGQVDASVGAGTRTVEDGSRLVQKLGDVIGQLGVTVHDAVGLMRQVEGSARQHQAGVAQVSQALTSMQKASESIRDGARLLGELSGKAHGLSSGLQAAAGAYVLPAAQPRAEA